MALLPIHPPPEAGEALSSWVARLARTYGMRPVDFASRYAGGAVSARSLDEYPRLQWVAALSEKTGVAPDEIRAMSMEGCLDKVQGHRAKSVGTVLIPPSMRTNYRKSIRMEFGPGLPRSCPLCVNGPNREYAVPLAWRFSFSLCCPIHGVLLDRQDPLSWRVTLRPPPKTVYFHTLTPATAAEMKHDSRLTTALRGDGVQVRVGVMAASTWLNGLGQLRNELLQPGLMLQLPAVSRLALGLTDRDRRLIVRSPRGGVGEIAGETSRQRFARAVATAVDLIENGRMMAMGRGPFVSAIRPKVLRPRPERVQLTYSEPENARRPPFDWGDYATDWEEFFETGMPLELRMRHERYLKTGEPKVISS